MAGPEGHALGQVRLWMAAADDKGRRTRLRQELITLGPDGERPSEGAYRFVVEMKLRAGQQTVVVGVRDEATHTESILLGVVTVP